MEGGLSVFLSALCNLNFRHRQNVILHRIYNPPVSYAKTVAGLHLQDFDIER